MDHKLAEQKHAVDRYILNELTLEERREFEEHLFDCPACADEVRRDAIFVDNARQVMLEEKLAASRSQPQTKEFGAFHNWLAWFRPAAVMPTFAALAFAAILGYQTFVYIPGLQQPQVLSTKVIAPVARDRGPVIGVDRRFSRFNLNFEVDSPQAYASYQCEFQNESARTILTLDSGPRQVASFTLEFLLPTKRFPPGRYSMILRPATEPQTEIQRYPFVIQDGGTNP
ncbi:MAG: zf-HC2 domain-containing protein [Acidobacteriaceae bacterium]|nr:zf-HC2 domain-containing protein [Acidobacteriaceae bacterium]MBV9295124.1 zf-HC2 domain-containing protein [Acidobacteriaceae bacterium]MBV9765679.1 zf-HC2 domain-containing protein [Acidobacteriaceae bacterium]